jgi:hypothetical protein
MMILFSGCGGKPPHHPKNPHYEIKKPKIKYRPSKKNLAKMVKQLQGSPYVWAEEGPNYFDCSGFTYYMYGSMGIEIPRTAREQAKVGKYVAPNALQYGDLIFFATSKRSRHKITHVGMYLGDGWFTHASTVKHEVIYSNLFKSKYYQNKLRICRRYLPEKNRKLIAPKQPLWTETSTATTSSKPSSMKKAIVIKAPRNQLENITPEGTYYVQIGSFVGNPEVVLMARIKAQNLHYKIIRFSQNGKKVSKLLVGPYKTRNQALIMLKQVRTTIEPTAFIAEIR